jgi:hypothetical protein
MALWIGILAGPIVWFVVLEANYVLSYAACESRHTWFLHAGNIFSIVLVAAAGWLAWRSGQPAADRAGTLPGASAPGETRARWMSTAGVVLSLWFMLVILAMEIPMLVLRACGATS